MAIEEDSDEWSEVKWEIEAYLDRHANLDAAAGHSHLGDQDMIDLDEMGYDDQEAFKTATFGYEFGVNSDILVNPHWYDVLKLKKPKHKGAELWMEATTKDGDTAAYAFESWLTKNGYEVVDRLSGDSPSRVEAEIQIDHLLSYVAEDQEVSEEDVDRVLRAEFSDWIMHDNVYWLSSSGEIETFAKPRESMAKPTKRKRKKKNPNYEQFTVAELDAMSTISSGHMHDLKHDDGQLRYWLSRMSVEDGEVAAIYVEELQDGRWVDVHQYGEPQYSEDMFKKMKPKEVRALKNKLMR